MTATIENIIGSAELQGMIQWAGEREKSSRCSISRELVRGYRFKPARRMVLSLANRLEGGRFYSQTLREILRVHHGVDVGKYTYGRILTPGICPPGTRVGNYCALGPKVVGWTPAFEHISQHPFFRFGEVDQIMRDGEWDWERHGVTAGHDVYVGNKSTLLPECRNIGDGAIIGAGAVVGEDVEPYTVVAGNPARVIRKRFADPAVERRIRDSQWWLLSLPELIENIEAFLNPATIELFDRIRFGAAADAVRNEAV